MKRHVMPITVAACLAGGALAFAQQAPPPKPAPQPIKSPATPPGLPPQLAGAPEVAEPDGLLNIDYVARAPRGARVTLMIRGVRVTGELKNVTDDGAVILALDDGRLGFYRGSSIDGVEMK